MRPRTLLLLFLPVAAFVLLLLLLSSEEQPAGHREPEAPDRRSGPVDALPPAPEPQLPESPVEQVAGKKPEAQAPAPQPSSVSGRIVIGGPGDLSGIPIVVARYESPDDPPDLDVWFETVTGPDGGFHVDGLLPGRHGLVARPPDLPARRVKFEVPPEGGDVPVEIRFASGGSLLVLIPGPEGKPRKDAMVSITRTGGGGGRFGRTDEKGQVLFTHLEPGVWSVKVDAGFGWGDVDRFEAIEPVTVSAGETTRHTVGGSAWVRGVVLGPKGKRLFDAIVRLRPVDYQKTGYRMLQTRTNREGRYLLRKVRAAEYDVEVQVTGEVSWASHYGRVTLRIGESKTYDIRVPDTSLSGRATRADTEEPLRSGQVQISAYAVSADGVATGRSYMAFARESGRFAFVGLPPGRYSVWVTPLRHSLRLKDETRIVEFPVSGHLEGVDFALEPKDS